MDIALFLTGWLLAACALGFTIARAIPRCDDDQQFIFDNHGEAYTND